MSACGKNSLALRLASKLADLRAEKTNLRLLRKPGFHVVTSTNAKGRPIGRPCIGRGDRIRTCGLYVPNVALYQTEPHLVII